MEKAVLKNRLKVARAENDISQEELANPGGRDPPNDQFDRNRAILPLGAFGIPAGQKTR